MPSTNRGQAPAPTSASRSNKQQVRSSFLHLAHSSGDGGVSSSGGGNSVFQRPLLPSAVDEYPNDEDKDIADALPVSVYDKVL